MIKDKSASPPLASYRLSCLQVVPLSMTTLRMQNDLPPPLPPAAVAIAMPVAELAGALLAHLEQTERTGRFHRGNYLGSMNDAFGRDVARALAEAWAWLEREVLLAHPWDNPEAGVFMLSRQGHECANLAAFARYRQASMLSKGMLHIRVADQAWLPFLMGSYDTAVFAAFKTVEIEVARKSGCDGQGATLMRTAFNKDTGPLRDQEASGPEREGMAHLFAGAFQTFRNPAGHREIVYSDPAEPAELLIVASHLMRILDGSKPLITRLHTRAAQS